MPDAVDHRGKGAQAALMAERIAQAQRERCEWVTTETGIAVDRVPTPSLDNMLRAGLGALCIRRNWVFDPPAT